MKEKTGFIKRPNDVKEKEKYLLLFIVAFVGMMLAFIPTIITNGGVFLYYGDFNSQQVMFHKHAVETVHSGGFGWDWGTDLGTSFIGSYSFYVLGSPFFWLECLFPAAVVPYILPWVLALKTAVASVTAYAFIRRFVDDKNACFIGGLLYAFSGFQTYNVFFNHFHDATAFFPLLLLGFELLIKDKKRGAFALAVAICATVSYFFFACEVIFLIIYFFARLTDKETKITLKDFGFLMLESVLGVMIAATILLPSVLVVLANPRLDNHLYGLDLAVYNDKTRIARIIQAFFMLSDMPARIGIFGSADSAKWSSLAGYLPLFSMCGVIAYIRTKGKNWLSKIFWVCAFMACVPILNSTFILFNSSYYTRWFYMPILIMCLMTAKVVGEQREDLKKGFFLTAGVGLLFIIIGYLPKKVNDKLEWGKIPKYPELYTIQATVTIIMIIALAVAVFYVVKEKKATPILSGMTAVACVVCMSSSVYYGASQGEYSHEKYLKYGINGKENLDMEKLDADFGDSDNNFYRIDTSQDVDNWCMFWNLSSMRTFHSVVSPSIMEFYRSIDQTRDVASRIDTDYYALRGLLSVRYYFNQLTTEQLKGTQANNPSQYMSKLEGFKYVDTQNGFNIYENENWVPMGFAYDKYTTDSVIKTAGKEDKPNILMEAMVLDSNQIAKYSDVIEKYDKNQARDNASYVKACADKRAHSCYYFKEDSDGFDAKINLDEDRLVFFSVPFDNGWSATVNGEETDVEKVSYGFMAVLCHKGENTIRFDYKTPGLTAGKIITVVGVLGLIAYVAPAYIKRKKELELEAEQMQKNKKPANKNKKKK